MVFAQMPGAIYQTTKTLVVVVFRDWVRPSEKLDGVNSDARLSVYPNVKTKLLGNLIN